MATTFLLLPLPGGVSGRDGDGKTADVSASLPGVQLKTNAAIRPGLRGRPDDKDRRPRTAAAAAAKPATEPGISTMQMTWQKRRTKDR